MIRWFVVALLSAGMFLGWLLLLAGNSALQRVCTNDCRYVTGFTWWIVWAQLFIFLASLPVQLGKLASFRNTLLAIVAVLSVVEIIQADRLLDYKDRASFGHSSRINATVAGHSVLAAFNLLTILFLGFVTFDDVELDKHDAKDYNTKHVPQAPTTPTYDGHKMKPMTSRASSMRASSPPTSEASYPPIRR